MWYEHMQIFERMLTWLFLLDVDTYIFGTFTKRPISHSGFNLPPHNWVLSLRSDGCDCIMSNVDSPAPMMEKIKVDKSKNKIQWLAVKGHQKGGWVCWVRRWKRQTGCFCERVCVWRWGGTGRSSQRASGMIGKVGGGGLPAAKLQSPGCHLHYLTFHPLETPSCYCSSLNCFLLIKKRH